MCWNSSNLLCTNILPSKNLSWSLKNGNIKLILFSNKQRNDFIFQILFISDWISNRITRNLEYQIYKTLFVFIYLNLYILNTRFLFRFQFSKSHSGSIELVICGFILKRFLMPLLKKKIKIKLLKENLSVQMKICKNSYICRLFTNEHSIK